MMHQVFVQLLKNSVCTCHATNHKAMTFKHLSWLPSNSMVFSLKMPKLFILATTLPSCSHSVGGVFKTSGWQTQKMKFQFDLGWLHDSLSRNFLERVEIYFQTTKIIFKRSLCLSFCLIHVSKTSKKLDFIDPRKMWKFSRSHWFTLGAKEFIKAHLN